MAGFHQYSAPYDDHALEVTWRLSYAIGLIPLIGILLYRIFRCVTGSMAGRGPTELTD